MQKSAKKIEDTIILVGRKNSYIHAEQNNRSEVKLSKCLFVRSRLATVSKYK